MWFKIKRTDVKPSTVFFYFPKAFRQIGGGRPVACLYFILHNPVELKPPTSNISPLFPEGCD